MTAELISRRAFARLKKWAPSYVVKLCSEGKIPLFVECPADGCGSTCNVTDVACACGQPIAGVVDAKKAKINPVLAEQTLASAKHPEKQHVADRHASTRGSEAESEGSGELPLDEDGEATVTGFAEWKMRSERAKAEKAELELQRQRGELGELETMRREAFKIARQVRDSMTALPDRMAPILAAEREAAQVHHLLLEEITRVLDELYRTLGDEPGDQVAAG